MATVVNYHCLYSNRFTYSPQSNRVCTSPGVWEVDASNSFPCSARVLVTFCSSFSQGTAVRLCFPVSPTYPYPLCLAKLYLFVKLKSTPKPEKKEAFLHMSFRGWINWQETRMEKMGRLEEKLPWSWSWVTREIHVLLYNTIREVHQVGHIMWRWR